MIGSKHHLLVSRAAASLLTAPSGAVNLLGMDASDYAYIYAKRLEETRALWPFHTAPTWRIWLANLVARIRIRWACGDTSESKSTRSCTARGCEADLK